MATVLIICPRMLTCYIVVYCTLSYVMPYFFIIRNKIKAMNFTLRNIIAIVTSTPTLQTIVRGGHSGAVVTHLPPTSDVGGSNPGPYARTLEVG